jgi:predicted Zn-dependent protease
VLYPVCTVQISWSNWGGMDLVLEKWRQESHINPSTDQCNTKYLFKMVWSKSGTASNNNMQPPPHIHSYLSIHSKLDRSEHREMLTAVSSRNQNINQSSSNKCCQMVRSKSSTEIPYALVPLISS